MSVIVAALHSLGRKAETKREREGQRKVLRERPDSTERREKGAERET